MFIDQEKKIQLKKRYSYRNQLRNSERKQN